MQSWNSYAKLCANSYCEASLKEEEIQFIYEGYLNIQLLISLLRTQGFNTQGEVESLIFALNLGLFDNSCMCIAKNYLFWEIIP